MAGSIILLFANAVVSVASAARVCPEQFQPRSDGIVSIKDDGAYEKQVLARKDSDSGKTHGTYLLTTADTDAGKALWKTDCDVFLREGPRPDQAICPQRAYLSDLDRMKVDLKGGEFSFSLWRFHGTLDSSGKPIYDPVLSDVPMSVIPDSTNKRIRWLNASVGTTQYFVYLGDTLNSDKEGYKQYTLEVFSGNDATCAEMLPDKVVVPSCADCSDRYPQPYKKVVTERVTRKPNEIPVATLQADVGGGHEPPRH
jgi:hypothetical protein